MKNIEKAAKLVGFLLACAVTSIVVGISAVFGWPIGLIVFGICLFGLVWLIASAIGGAEKAK